MLRVNLLPSGYASGDRFVRAIVLCTILTVLEAAACFLLWLPDAREQTENMGKQAAKAQQHQQELQRVQGEISAVQAEMQPYQDKLDHMIELREWSKYYPVLMRRLAARIYERTELLNVTYNDTSHAIQMAARTKTTEDLARTLIMLKTGYVALAVDDYIDDDGNPASYGPLFVADSVNVSGVTGWPYANGPRGWDISAYRHMVVPWPFSEQDDLVAVGSNSLVDVSSLSAGGGGGGGGGSEPESGEAAPAEGGSGGSGGGGGGGGAAGAGSLGIDLSRSPVAVRQIVLPPLPSAMLRYIRPSQDPPPQPYLVLGISATIATDQVPPDEGAGGGGGGGGMGGFSDEMPMEPAGEMSGAAPPAE